MDFVQILTAGIEAALNHYIALDAEAPERFGMLEGKVISIEILGLNQTISLFPSADGFLLLSDFDGEADATITGSPLALFRLGMAEDVKKILFGGDIQLSGDTALANKFSRLLSQLDIDWEEILAQNVGDIVAHKTFNMAKEAAQWIKRSSQSFSMDSGEYLQEEVRLSPSNAELRQFINQVDGARETVDRLAARIQLITTHKNKL
ncbi:hypothetical protein MNBD_GAMMA09-1891 [hydrothermal vent metagenome]|uniref:SCP2 domain-containing protein n=1 Tax=hydrothermal vent metagenome TaxID=652676 RepID=A0A3B0YKN2_9ZZZZ